VSAESKQLAEVGRKRRVGGVEASQLLRQLPFAAANNFPVVHGCAICPFTKVEERNWHFKNFCASQALLLSPSCVCVCVCVCRWPSGAGILLSPAGRAEK
jgi:hypothetical protein